MFLTAIMLDSIPSIGNGQTMKSARHPRRRSALRKAGEIGPIPIRPPNYFADGYNPVTVREDNRLAKASMIRAPKDLE